MRHSFPGHLLTAHDRPLAEICPWSSGLDDGLFPFALGVKREESARPMKTNILIATALVALITSGCGQKDTSTTSAASAAPAGPREIEITANDLMKYSVATIEAKPGEALKVVLTNIGTQPKEVMGHDWVLLKAGTDAAAFDTAALSAKDTGYIPAALSDQIIAKIDLLGPRKSGEVEFTAPTTPGDYTYLCTFPAHFQTGMKGVLTVK
jgi:azurin